MRTLSMAFALVCCAVLQAILPSWTAMGQAKAPLLLGATLYYALNHERRLMLQAAILAGLLQDALGMIPLGFSSFCFCLAGLTTARFKEIVFVQQWITHVLVGALAAGGVTLLLYVLLAHDASAVASLSWLAARVAGSVLLGALFVPVVFGLLARLDRLLGNIETRAV